MGPSGEIDHDDYDDDQNDDHDDDIDDVQDCDTAPYSDSLLNYPSGLLNYDELMSFFDSEFGYTEREVTALMGAHTLGGAEIFNSGFNGVWVTDEAVSYISLSYNPG